MKKLCIFLLILLIGLQAGYARDVASSIESFKHNVLPAYRSYFYSAELTFKGQLKLTALPGYALLSVVEKKAIMDKLVYSWQMSLVLVQYESQRELWGWDSQSLESLFLDIWDINTALLPIVSAASVTGTNSHPWFYYVGGMFNLDSFKNITSTFSTSLGFFLLKNRWDLAATFSASVTGNFDVDSVSKQISAGLQSKIYFPLKRYKISPSIGAEIAWTRVNYAETPTITFTPAALLGISWYVGNGSLDFGLKIKKQTTAMIGYSFMPKFKK